VARTILSVQWGKVEKNPSRWSGTKPHFADYPDLDQPEPRFLFLSYGGENKHVRLFRVSVLTDWPG
jgi:hypothetical protein